MDVLNKFAGGSGSKSHDGQESAGKKHSHQNDGGFGDKLNSMAGGGSKGEKNEDLLDKGKLILPQTPV